MITKKNTELKKDIEYYLNLPWSYMIEQELSHDGDKIYIIRVNEIPGLVSDGETIQEAMLSIREAMIGWLEVSLKRGDEIPEPLRENQYMSNVAYKTTTDRHFFLEGEAFKRKLSINQFLDTLIDTVAATATKQK